MPPEETEAQQPKIMRTPLPTILDEMEASEKRLLEGLDELWKAIAEGKKATAEAREAAAKAEKAGLKAAQEAAGVAEAKVAEAQSALGQAIVALRQWAEQKFLDINSRLSLEEGKLIRLNEAMVAYINADQEGAVARAKAFNAKIKE